MAGRATSRLALISFRHQHHFSERERSHSLWRTGTGQDVKDVATIGDEPSCPYYSLFPRTHVETEARLYVRGGKRSGAGLFRLFLTPEMHRTPYRLPLGDVEHLTTDPTFSFS